MPLKAGYSYSFDSTDPDPADQQYEVRRISTHQLVGYVWLSYADTPDGLSITAEPSKFVDSDRDGFVNAAEMNASLDKVEKEVVVAPLPRSAATRFSGDIRSARALVKRGRIAGAYRRLMEVRDGIVSKLKAVEQKEAADRAAKERAAKDRTVMLCAGVAVAVVIALGVTIALTLGRRKAVAQNGESAPDDTADPPREDGA